MGVCFSTAGEEEGGDGEGGNGGSRDDHANACVSDDAQWPEEEVLRGVEVIGRGEGRCVVGGVGDGGVGMGGGAGPEYGA